MSDEFSLTGRVLAVKPRGAPKNGVQTFWTLEIQERESDQYTKKCSFNSHDKDGDATPEFKIAWEALQSGKPVFITGYTSPNERNPEHPYKNGTTIQWADETSGEVGEEGAVSRVAAPTGTPTSSGNSKDDYWKRREEQDEERQRHIVASWGIQTAVQLLGEEAKGDKARLEKVAVDLIILKTKLAEDLKGWA